MSYTTRLIVACGICDTMPKMIEALEADSAGWYRENKLEGTPPVPVGAAYKAG